MSLESCGTCSTWKALDDLCRGKLARFGGLGFQPMYDDQYVRRFIDSSSATLGADVLAKANMTDPDGDYIYFTGLANRVAPTRAEENFVTDENNENFKLGTGLKVSFRFEFWNRPESMADRINGFTCKPAQAYFQDYNGSLVGSEIVDGNHNEFYGWAINMDSLVATYVPPTGEATEMVVVVFDLVMALEKASNYSILSQKDLGYNAGTTLLPAKHMEAVATVVDATHLKVVLRTASLTSGKYMYGRGFTVANGGVWKVVNEDGTSVTLLAAAVVFTDVDPDATAPGNEPSYTLTITGAVGSAGDEVYVDVVFPGFLVQDSNYVTLT